MSEQLHFVMTIQWTQTPPPTSGGTTAGKRMITIPGPSLYTATNTGIVDPAKGTTRERIFLDVVAATRKKAGLADDVVISVIFWSLDSNRVN
ncbi:hypothetical protein [Streptomyces sp. SID3212]|uniref:hypothetical protein n=1 Tax=Streptomyces sp. SID3212 TaxID=2690259 RepID=UPI00136E2F0C|nr:hypothetical protein [Streptomyces sp. SID3212]MYV53131.1 hypothetical protein [Streptomyces sp. SID3212]